MESEFKVGDLVRWWKSTYYIIEIRREGAMLQQNFSIGTRLIKPVPLSELKKVTAH
jgi:hypothetical protein